MVMDPELSEVKPLRARLGLTQKQLAQLSGVSQSLIAKIEAGQLDPSYSSGKRILAALRTAKHKAEATAQHVMQRHTVSVGPEEKVHMAIAKMQKKAISQLPVLDTDNVLGLLTESSIIRQLGKINHERTLVRDVMEEAPPIVPPETPLSVVAELLTHYSLVLVKRQGKMKGIITKSDVLKAV